MSQEDKRALDIINETAKLENRQYEIALLWKINPPCLDNNRIVAKHRLSLLKKRLLNDQDLFTKYKSCIDDLLQKGYAKRAPESAIRPSQEKCALCSIALRSIAEAHSMTICYRGRISQIHSSGC